MYFQLLPIGLRSEENPGWGGWGGRFAPVTGGGWSDIPFYLLHPSSTFDASEFPTKYPHVVDSGSGSTDPAVQESYPLARWIPEFQNDMLSRSQWQVTDYAHANHPPVAFVPFFWQNLSAAPGELVCLHGFAADPDGDKLTTLWWQYREAGTYPNAVAVMNPNSLDAVVLMPKDAVRGQTIHLILQVSDSGTPQLTRYQRVIVTCK